MSSSLRGEMDRVDCSSELITLVADFFQVPQDEVRARLEVELSQPGTHVTTAWRVANPLTESDIVRFYQETTSYVYDLAADHCRRDRRTVWESVLQRVERRGVPQEVLIYGDGIGTDSIALARRGHHVTYFDLPGVTSGFARFRFQRERLAARIRVLENAEEIRCQAFGAVVCIEVLEHLTNPLEVLKRIHGALRPGGIALITESFESIGPAYPSHLAENFKYAGQVHRIMESLGFANTYYNINPINRPMEFTKVSGIGGALLRESCRLRRAVESRVRRFVRSRPR